MRPLLLPQKFIQDVVFRVRFTTITGGQSSPLSEYNSLKIQYNISE